jgi:hypothetical protein
MVNNGHGILNMNIFVSHFLDLYVGDIDVSDVDTVRAIVTITIVNLARSQGNPRNIGGGTNPADKTRSPVNSSFWRRDPAPSD